MKHAIRTIILKVDGRMTIGEMDAVMKKNKKLISWTLG